MKVFVIQIIYTEAARSCYYFFQNKTFVTDFTADRKYVFSPVPFEKRQDYGHQAISIILSCNGLVLNYAILMYDKSQSKIKMVQDIASELPEAPVVSYLLCDSWYTCKDIMDAFIKKGFYTIGALKTNRILYPCGIKQKLNEFVLHLQKTDAAVSLVTVGSRSYDVYRYEGNLHGVENAVVLISYPKGAFHNPKALRAFICTDVSLSTLEILKCYTERWPIEVFFRQGKKRLALDQYQIRSSKGIQRYWLLMSLAHYICCMGSGKELTFEDGYTFFRKQLLRERM